VLEEWLQNPFLDDDVASLSFRLGADLVEVSEALGGLCDAGFLRSAGSGYTLTLDLGGTIPEALPPPADSATKPADEPSQAVVQLASLSGAVIADPAEEEQPAQVDADEDQELLELLSADDRVDALAREIEQTLTELLPDEPLEDAQLVDALPFGMLVLRPTGATELANDSAARMLGVPREDLDGASFEIATGVNPLAALDEDRPLSFSLTEPRAMEVNLHSRRLPSGAVIVIMIRDVSLLEEVANIQAEAQEELYERLKGDMVHPLAMIEKFLEHPDASGLVQARVAMEQINWFLQEFFLGRIQDDRSDGGG
jgi:PAS domain-containing protein